MPTPDRVLIATFPAIALLSLFTIIPGLSPNAFADVHQASELRVPPGFTVEAIASPPLVERPMMAGFDDRGRLFVAESAGLNLDFNKLRENPPNFIRMLEDSDGDGKFDKSTIFADRMTLPSGALWHQGALYVASPPSLWKLEDLDDDGVCDKRTEIVTGFGSIGNGADLHGPFLGPDGWLYFSDGRNGHRVTLHDGTIWEGKAAGVYRCRTDGSGLEVVFGGGMDNPVEVVFTREGEMLVGCNIVMAHPQRLDAILFGIEGGVYPHDACLREYKRSGDLLKPVGDLGWVAISGLMRYAGDAFGGGLDSNLFSAQFNPHRVQRHIVARDGAGFRISSEDFLACANPDFHPTDALQDADGSLLVIDTGGWFRIGCPASQTEKPDVLGAIYRVRRSDAPSVDDPRGSKLKWDVAAEELVRRLEDSRPAVVERTVIALATTDQAARELETLAVQHASPLATTAIWILARRDTPFARASVGAALLNPDNAARRTAIRAAGLNRDVDAAAQLHRSLSHPDLAEAREAALALGRIGDKTSTAALLAELKRAADPFHEHAVIYALIQIADRAGIAAGLSDRNAAVRRGAMIALDQMKDGKLLPEEIIPLLGADNASVRQEAMTIVSTRPQWAGQVAAQLRAALAKSHPDAQEQLGLRGMVVAFAGDEGVQAVVSDALHDGRTPVATRVMLLEAITAAPLKVMPTRWNAAISAALDDNNEAVVRQAVEVARVRGGDAFDQRLIRIARDTHCGRELRVAALAAAAPRIKPGADDWAFLLSQLDPAQPPLTRLVAAQCIARLALNDAQLTELAAMFATAGALEAPHLLAAFEKATSGPVGNALLAALQKYKAAKSLSPAVLRAALQNFPADVLASAAPLLAMTQVGAQQRQARLAELEPLLNGGDASRGQSVFLSKTAACTTCHTVGGIGTAVGPDLTKIGSIRSGQDLLESIIFPSASIARGFEPFVVQTTDGKTYAGMLAVESADSICLKTPAHTVIPRSQIKVFREDAVSIMPQGLDAQLSRQELTDLLAFLQACK